MSTLNVPTVVVAVEPTAEYPAAPPFDPSEAYPELASLSGGPPPLSAGRNDAFRMVRESLAKMGLDREHLGTPDWNPLLEMVSSTELIVLKPNLVLESPPAGYNPALVTHGSVVRAMITYARLAAPHAEILVGDVPLQGADFDQIVHDNGLRATVDELRARGDHRLSLHDLRRERAIVDEVGFIRELRVQSGDPRGYVEVDVGSLSLLEGLEPDAFEAFAVSDYHSGSTVSAHTIGQHKYLIPRSILEAGLIINLPKLKTHQKAALTVAIKNLVGVNGDKARIPHFRVDNGGQRGDEYPTDYSRLWSLRSKWRSRLQGNSRFLFLIARQIWRAVKQFVPPPQQPGAASVSAGAATLVAGGAWFGNDTLWRALHDLNHILLFAGTDGKLHAQRQRRYFCVVDGIVAGEGDGPLNPIPRVDGVILCGDDALAIDMVAARYMGLDWQRIPTLASAIRQNPGWTRVSDPIEKGGIEVSAVNAETVEWAQRPFLPPPGWIRRVELETAGRTSGARDSRVAPDN